MSSQLIRAKDNIRGDLLKPSGAMLIGMPTKFNPYLQTLSQIKNGDEVSVWRFLNPDDHESIRSYTSVADHTSGMQDAFDSGAYSLKVPPGGLNLTDELSINTNGLRLIGSGAERTKLIQNSSNKNGIVSNTTINRLLWCELKDLRIELPGGTSGTGIWIRNPEVFTGKHLRVTTLSGIKTTGYGIRIEKESVSDYGYYLNLEHSHFDKCATGVRVEGQNPGGSNGNWLEKVISNNNTNYGFHILNNAGSFLSNCAAEENETNVYIQGGIQCGISKGRFERPGNHNIHLAGGQAHTVINSLIASAGNVTPATGRGVYVSAGQFHAIESNVFQDNLSSYDIEVLAGSINVSLLDNRARNVASGWDVGGVRVLDAGTRTIKRHLFNSSISSAISHETEEAFSSGVLKVGPAQARIYSGAGLPNGVVTASRGSIYLRSDGAAGTVFYVKETGDSTNTGWVAK